MLTLAALISAGELQRPERSAEVTRRLAQAMGQSPKLIEELKTGQVHYWHIIIIDSSYFTAILPQMEAK